MGFFGDLFGGNSGASFQAQGANPAQMNQAYANTQNGLNAQANFINALNTQNGIQNQSNVFNQQQGLAGQLQQMAAGAGPNPAQAQFRQNADQVAAQAAGLIGSQKGISPALQARLIAQQGAQAGQNMAAQAAGLQAQQQIAATQALQQQQNMMGNLATQQVGQQGNAIGAYTQGALGQQSNILGLQGNANSANAGVAGTVAKQQGGILGGVLGGIGSALSLAHGGEVPGYANGGETGPQSMFAKSLQGLGGEGLDGGGSLNSGMSSFLSGIANQFRPAVPQQMAGGAGDMSPLPSQPSGLGFGAAPVMNAAHGGAVKNYSKGGGGVPGKAKVRGDSPKNDTVPAKLSPGEVVIPRSIMQSDDPAGHAAKFVAAIMAKKGRRIG
jgi:hypothetical protein